MGNSSLLSSHPNDSQAVITIDQFYGKNYGNTLYQSKMSNRSNDHRILKKVLAFSDGSDHVSNYLGILQKIGSKVECDNLYLPIECKIKEFNKFCGEQSQLQLFYQIYDIKIKDEIHARKQQHQIFSQGQIWYILYSLLNACRIFQPYHIKSGPLKTSHILLNTHGHLKIINQLTQPQLSSIQPSPYSLTNFHSPEQLLLMRGNRNIVNDPNASQTFSIAIIVLELCTYIDGEAFYDMQGMRLNGAVIAKAEKMLKKNKYSELLQNLIKIMMSDGRDRPLPGQIYKAFRPYEKSIVSLKPFKFDPNRFHDSFYNSKASNVYY